MTKLPLAARAIIAHTLLLMISSTEGAALADEPFLRLPTFEERRMIDVALKTEGFSPCTELSLVFGRWACRARNAAGHDFQLSLSNLDFAVVTRRRLD